MTVGDGNEEPNGEATGLWQSIMKGVLGKLEGLKDAIESKVFAYISAAGVIYASSIYAKPQLLGLVLIGIGLVGAFLVAIKSRTRQAGKASKSSGTTTASNQPSQKAWPWLALTIPIVLIGLFITWNHQKLLLWELEHVSSFDLKRRPQVGIGASLDGKTLSKSSHGGIPRVPFIQRGPFRDSGRLLVVEDKTGLDDPTKAIKVEAGQLANLIPWRTNSSQGQTLNFLIGPAGSGKETILRQWVYAFEEDPTQHAYTHVFLLTAQDMVRTIEAVEKNDEYKELSLQNAIAVAYKGIVDDPVYYDLLLRNEPCLIVIPEWDLILAKLDKPEKRADFLHRVIDLVASDEYKASVLIGSRPAPILRDFSIDNANTFRFETFLRFLILVPWDKPEWEPFFRRRELQLLPAANYYNACKLIDTTGGSAGIPGSLAGNLEFLNLEVAESGELGPLAESNDYYNFAARLTRRVLERDTAITKEEQFTDAFKTFGKLAYAASAANTHNLEFSGRLTRDQAEIFSAAPFAAIENGEFVFSPSAVHSYFALEGFRSALKENSGLKCAPISDTLAQDIALFSPLPQEVDDVRQDITCSLTKSAATYKTSTKLLLSQTVASGTVKSGITLDCGAVP